MPRTNPVTIAVTKDLMNKLLKACPFEKSISNNPYTTSPTKSPVVIDKNVTLK